MSEVLFGHSYYLRFDPKLWAAVQPYPPLGTMYAASYLRARGYDVALFDTMLAESEAEWGQALDREMPHYAVLYEDNFNYLSKMCLLRMRQAAFSMIEMARERGCTVIAGGADATDHADLYLARGARFVIVGEGEHTLGELLERIAGRTDVPLESIPGLAFVDAAEEGRVRQTPRRSPISDLDSLPFPAWDLIDTARYQSLWQRHHRYYSMNVVTSRGCPYHCTWCAKPIWGQSYSVRSPENVVAELKWLQQVYHPDHIWFADDILGLQPGWLERLADLVEQQQVRIPFKSLHRADLLLNGQTIPALRRAGAQMVWLGAESGAQSILDAMDKGVKVEEVYEAARRLHAAGIQVGFFLQFGYPGEGLAEIARTEQMVRDCRPDDIGISVSYPLPGTRFYAEISSKLGARQNWTDSNDLAVLYETPYSTPFYRQLHKVTHREFRARKAEDGLREALRQPAGLRLGTLRLVAALAYYRLTLPLERRRLRRLAGEPPGSTAPPAGS